MPYELDTCAYCNSGDLISRPTLISQFISDYVFRKSPALSRIQKCKACEAIFHALRFTDQEVETLYRNYRGEDYFRTRHKYEFWYTRRYNENLGSKGEIEQRQCAVKNALSRHKISLPLNKVLDYGGDRGQLLENGPWQSADVFELSGVEPVAGINLIANEGQIQERNYDLALLCHVLEHASKPLQMLEAITRYIKPGGLLFLEVPREYIRLEQIPNNNWYRNYLRFLSRHRLLMTLLDFYSSFFRLKMGLIPPLGFVKMSEHLNFFNVRALESLLKRARLTILECGFTPETGQLMALARVDIDASGY